MALLDRIQMLSDGSVTAENLNRLQTNIERALARLAAAIPTLPVVFVKSGPTHADGLVPDPGATAGATRFLREDASWAAPVSTYPGRLQSFQVLVGGTTYTRPAGITSILVEGQGGGGGGGGCIIAGAAVSTAGAGGGSGTYGRHWYAVAPATGTYAIGAAGAAGANTGAGAGAGGATTFTDGTTLMTLPGGAGALTDPLATAAAATPAISIGGAAGAASTNSDIANRGQPGRGATRLSATAVASGAGAPGLFGGNGHELVAPGTGISAAVATGAGGGGGLALNSAAVTGGAGGSGWIVVWEFA